jgi:hypothetical protein
VLHPPGWKFTPSIALPGHVHESFPQLRPLPLVSGLILTLAKHICIFMTIFATPFVELRQLLPNIPDVGGRI